MKLSSTNPLGGFTDALKAALAAAQQLRNELAKLGAPKVGIPTAPTAPTSVIPEIPKTAANPLGIPSFYGYSGFGQPFLPSATDTSLTATELRIFIDAGYSEYLTQL